MDIPKSGYFDAFSVIVDINGFTRLVADHTDVHIATFVRDVLYGAIGAIEDAGGSVVGVMGDAVFGILPTAQAVWDACFDIAKDLDSQCSYLAQNGFQEAIPELPSLKIGVEFGALAVSTIQTTALGQLPFYIGPATNYAARILGAGSGNRCHIGPRAVAAGMDEYVDQDAFDEVAGKKGEPTYRFWCLDLSDVWVAGEPEDGRRRH